MGEIRRNNIAMSFHISCYPWFCACLDVVYCLYKEKTILFCFTSLFRSLYITKVLKNIVLSLYFILVFFLIKMTFYNIKKPFECINFYCWIFYYFTWFISCYKRNLTIDIATLRGEKNSHMLLKKSFFFATKYYHP